MKDLTALFATELSKKYPLAKEELDTAPKFAPAGRSFSQASVEKSVPQPKSILQLNASPFAIDIDKYKNPHSAGNPTGDYKAAYRLSLLADPIPQLTTHYADSLNSAEKVWGNIVNWANSKSSYTQHLLTEARNNFVASKLSGMGGVPDDWYPVYTTPSNWYEIVSDDSNLIEMEIDAIDGDTGENEFLAINGNEGFTWKINDQNKDTDQVELHSKTTIKKIILHVLRVDFIRPWLDFELLNTKNWEISGLEKGYFSNGQLDNNDGIFPLIAKSMLIGSKVSIEGDFDQIDIDVLSTNELNKNDLSIGPFLLNTNSQSVNINKKGENTLVTSNVKQIIGYISQLIPPSPYLSSV